MPTHHICQLDPNPPSPMQPICPRLFPPYRPRFFSSSESGPSRRKQKITSKKPKKKGLNIPDEMLVKFHRTHGADGRGIHYLLGSPYSNGVTAYRMLDEWWKKEGKELMDKLIKELEEGSWAEKHRPRRLNDFICNRDKALLLRDQAAQGMDSHFVFEGPPGVGKKTMVYALLREVFGPDALKTKEEAKIFELKGEEKASITINVAVSPHHIEINASELGDYEKHVITALVEETHIIATECNHNDSRAIVLYQADKLCVDIQHYIRWIMEKHQKCHKFLFCCSDMSNLEAVRSICTVIRLQPPSNDEIVKVLENIADKEGIKMHQNLAPTIANNSKHNLRQAILLFESSPQVKLNSHQTVSV